MSELAPLLRLVNVTKRFGGLTAVAGFRMLHELADFADHLGNELHGAAGVVRDVLVDGRLAGLGLQFRVDVGRRRHYFGSLFELYQRNGFAVINRRLHKRDPS